jgi:hypothetical protein
MDLNDVESIDFNALGGADTVVVNDLSGTDATEINLNLASAVGGGDAQADPVVLFAPAATTWPWPSGTRAGRPCSGWRRG